MLFNSYIFLLAFLPLVLAGFAYTCRKKRADWAVYWLGSASLVFYGWWTPRYLVLILVSITFNYALGRALCSEDMADARRRGWLVFGIVANLLAIAYFKYFGFFIDTLNATGLIEIPAPHIVLPLAISFFTFQQIAYLVDTYRSPPKASETFSKYLLFVTFFPQLIAGPIVHHSEVLPQLSGRFPVFRSENLNLGISILLVGLFKKVVVADFFAIQSTAVFDSTATGTAPSMIVAWIGALSYSMQIYFDFSGYSDMAIGLARLFGIALPVNFNSPYKARGIIDFWRRWHITLSTFLRDYLYIPLGGSRDGRSRRYVNLMITMLLGGLWHGASWTFVLWGALHGTYLIANHGYRALHQRYHILRPQGRFRRIASVLATYLAVLVAWVFFRADNLDLARRILSSMIGLNGITLPQTYIVALGHVPLASQVLDTLNVHAAHMDILNGRLWALVALLALGHAAVWTLPNTQEIFRVDEPQTQIESTRIPRWRPSIAWSIALGLSATVSLAAVAGKTEFLYFRF